MIVEYLFGKDLSPIFCDDQVNVHPKQAVPAVPNIVGFLHRLITYNLTMQRLQDYQHELMPAGDQQGDMRRFAGSSRFVFNKALALETVDHAAGNTFINVLRAGYARIACEVNGEVSRRQQEPTERAA